MDFTTLSYSIGLGGFILWGVLERAFLFAGWQQRAGRVQHHGATGWIGLFWFGAFFFSLADASHLRLTLFTAPLAALRSLGILLTLGGLLVRFLARLALGRQYSVRLETSPDHTLVTSGIYRLIRHPAYLGLLCLFAGIPLCLGSWGGLLIALAGGFPAILYRIGVEERLLSGWFGGLFEAYKEKTWRLIPGLW